MPVCASAYVAMKPVAAEMVTVKRPLVSEVSASKRVDTTLAWVDGERRRDVAGTRKKAAKPAAGSDAVKHSHWMGDALPLYSARNAMSRGERGTSWASTGTPLPSSTDQLATPEGMPTGRRTGVAAKAWPRALAKRNQEQHRGKL